MYRQGGMMRHHDAYAGRRRALAFTSWLRFCSFCGIFALSDGFRMASVTCVAVVILIALISPSLALYFHIGETEKKCFIEEIPDETMVIGELTC